MKTGTLAPQMAVAYLILSVLRFVFKLLLGWISFLTVHANPKRRAIHDMVGHSVMIDIKKPEPDED